MSVEPACLPRALEIAFNTMSVLCGGADKIVVTGRGEALDVMEVTGDAETLKLLDVAGDAEALDALEVRGDAEAMVVTEGPPWIDTADPEAVNHPEAAGVEETLLGTGALVVTGNAEGLEVGAGAVDVVSVAETIAANAIMARALKYIIAAF